MTRPARDPLAYCGLLAALALGAGLRLYRLSGQVLLDDEWHAIAFARVHSLVEVLTRVNVGANSPAMNLYAWLALHTLGYSEWILRLPSLAAGLLSLVLLPLLARSIMTLRSAAVFASLLAVSPTLIYYSRLSRAYAGYALFGFLALLSVYLWATSGSRKWAVWLAILSAVAVSYHLLAAAALAVPLAVVWLARLLAPPGGRLPLHHRVVLGWQALLGGTLAAGVCATLAALPGLHGFPVSNVMTLAARVTGRTLLSAASLISGTANPISAAVFWSLLFCGLVLLWRRDQLLTGIFVAVSASYVVTLSLVPPADANVALVLVRYCVLLLPIGCFLVAIAVDWLLERLARWLGLVGPAARAISTSLGVAALIAVLILTGPLPGIYLQPNSFTNHFAYQQSYAATDWSSPSPAYSYMPVLDAGTLSPFYRTLGETPGNFSIIEYPMFIGNHSNLHYYSQHFHGKRTLIGYANVEGGSRPPSYAFDRMFPDEIIGRAPNRNWVKLSNLVCVTDLSALRNSGARYVVLHRDLLLEGFGVPMESRSSRLGSNGAMVERLEAAYREAFGPPSFVDRDLVVFEISP